MRFRVKQVGERYYPQYKALGLLWLSYKTGMKGIGYYPTVFWDLGDAMSFLQGVQALGVSEKRVVKMHEYPRFDK